MSRSKVAKAHSLLSDVKFELETTKNPGFMQQRWLKEVDEVLKILTTIHAEMIKSGVM